MIKLIEPLELRIFLAAIGPDDYGYAADGTTYEDINLVAGDAGVVDIADLNLAGNTFNFYGHVYSAADQFTVYRRGLIRLGGSNAFNDSNNNQLGGDKFYASRLYQRAIAPMWDAWSLGMLAKLDDTSGDGTPDRLIIQWSGGASLNVKFQAILQLNTGDTPGDITFNYVDLDTGDPDTANGASATVGIKDSGNITTKLLLSYNDFDNPILGAHKAILIHNTASGQPVADSISKPVDQGEEEQLRVQGIHSFDPNQSAKTLKYEWDLDADGVYGETGADAPFGDEIGPRPTYVRSTLFRLTPYVILRVTDDQGFVSYDDSPIIVRNVPPTAVISGASSVDAGDVLTLTLTATDPSPTDTVRAFLVDWGDGHDQDYVLEDPPVTEATVDASHSYSQPGAYTISVRAQQFEVGAPATQTITVGPRRDLVLNSLGILFITNTTGNNAIAIDVQGDSARLTRNGTVTTYPLASVKGIDMASGGGDDTITSTLNANTTVFSGDGDDSIVTGAGIDSINSGDGADTVSSGDGQDHIVTGGDIDARIGAQIDAGASFDLIESTFATTINAGSGDDTVTVGAADSIFGGDGNEFITANVFVGTIDGGAGFDVVRANSDAAHPAILIGGDGGDFLFASAGRDSLYGGAGSDTLYGGDGSDLLSGGGGNDALFGQGGNDRLYGGAGIDRLEGQGGDDRFVGGAGADLLVGGFGINTRFDNDPLDQLIDVT